MNCNVFNTEYTAEYTNKKQKRVPTFVSHDCFAKPIDDEAQIDSRLGAFSTGGKFCNDELIKKLISQRLRSVYQVDYKNKFQSSTDGAENFDDDSELLKYSIKLYSDPHEEAVLATPSTAKRVFGFASPKQLHSVLSTYQNTFGRTGARIMIKNATLIATRKRRRAYAMP